MRSEPGEGSIARVTAMTPTPTKQCPKCDSTMQTEKHLQALGSEVELVSKSAFLGDTVKVYYCEKCGFIELYREKKT